MLSALCLPAATDLPSLTVPTYDLVTVIVYGEVIVTRSTHVARGTNFRSAFLTGPCRSPHAAVPTCPQPLLSCGDSTASCPLLPATGVTRQPPPVKVCRRRPPRSRRTKRSTLWRGGGIGTPEAACQPPAPPRHAVISQPGGVAEDK